MSTEQEILSIGEYLVTMPEQPPSWAGGDRLWFNQVPHDWQQDRDCTRFLIVKGVGKGLCPVDEALMSLAVAGTIIFVLSGEYLKIPSQLIDQRQVYEYTWAKLWHAIWENRTRLDELELDQEFIAWALRCFILRPAKVDIRDNRFLTNRFAECYETMKFACAFEHRLGSPINKLSFDGSKEEPKPSLLKLTCSAQKVVQYMPGMLEIIIRYIRG